MSAQTLPARAALGAAAVFRPREAARHIPGVSEEDAIAWMRRRGLVRAHHFGSRPVEVVVWGEVVKALASEPDPVPSKRPPPLPKVSVRKRRRNRRSSQPDDTL